MDKMIKFTAAGKTFVLPEELSELSENIKKSEDRLLNNFECDIEEYPEGGQPSKEAFQYAVKFVIDFSTFVFNKYHRIISQPFFDSGFSWGGCIIEWDKGIIKDADIQYNNNILYTNCFDIDVDIHGLAEYYLCVKGCKECKECQGKFRVIECDMDKIFDMDKIYKLCIQGETNGHWLFND